MLQYRLIEPQVSWFIFQYLQSPNGQQSLLSGSAGSGRLNLNAPNLEKINIPFPSLEEQKLIIGTLEEKLDEIEHSEKSFRQEYSNISLLRQSILEQAFTGQLVPQDPNDESASELLKRIQAEKKLALEEVKMNRVNKPKAKSVESKSIPTLLEVLKNAGKPMTPEEVFRAAGYDHESLEKFFFDLKVASQNQQIRQVESLSTTQDRMLESTP